MTMPEGLPDRLPVPAGGPVRNPRSRDDRSNGLEAGADDLAFSELVSAPVAGGEEGESGTPMEEWAAKALRPPPMPAFAMIQGMVGAGAPEGETETTSLDGNPGPSAGSLDLAAPLMALAAAGDGAIGLSNAADAVEVPPFGAANDLGLDMGKPSAAKPADLAAGPAFLGMGPEIEVSDASVTSRLPGVAELTDVNGVVLRQETHFGPVRASSKALNILAHAEIATGEPSGLDALDPAGDKSEEGSARSVAPVGPQDDENGPWRARGEQDPRGSSRQWERDDRGSLARQLFEAGVAERLADRRDALAGRLAGMELALSQVGAAGAVRSSTSLVQQIATGIADELAAPRGAAVWTADEAGGASRLLDGPVKVLHIELEPADLGKVTVRLSLKDNVLDVHLEASHRETADAIVKDRALLSNALRAAGYAVDAITAQAAEPLRTGMQPPAAPGDAHSQHSATPQGQSGLSHPHRNGGGDPTQNGAADALTSGSGAPESVGTDSRVASGVIYV